ncbi:MAG: hypothetical protein RIG61_14205 [Deltaproteobacteria bacterium]
MKGKKKKEEDTSSGTPKKKSGGSSRLSSMIESMQKRGSPVNAHRVATKYFESFKKERNIPSTRDVDDVPAGDDTAVETGIDTGIITAVDNAVDKKPSRKTPPEKRTKEPEVLKDLYSTLTPSESNVYRAMYGVCEGKKTDSSRFGLKELRELTGLSDKTVRVAIHSLERKLCIKVIESSLGIYGRKFLVLRPNEIEAERIRAGLEIDPTTKKILSRDTPISNAVTTGVSTGVITAVNTAIEEEGAENRSHKEKTKLFYEKYTGKKWGKKDEMFYEKIADRDIGVIEAALILNALKGKGGRGSISDIESVLTDLGASIQSGYLEQLRGVWKNMRSGKS